MNLPRPENERRVFQRRPLRATARLYFAGGQTTEVRTFDISEGGLGIVADVSPTIGMSFGIKVRVPAGAAGLTGLDTTVTVVRSVLAGDEGGFKVGLKFVALDRSHLTTIKRFLNPT